MDLTEKKRKEHYYGNYCRQNSTAIVKQNPLIIRTFIFGEAPTSIRQRSIKESRT